MVAPSFTVASYCLASSINFSHNFVALPMSSTSTPVANGSSVPACPIFTPRGSNRFTFATAAAEFTKALELHPKSVELIFDIGDHSMKHDEPDTLLIDLSTPRARRTGGL